MGKKGWLSAVKRAVIRSYSKDKKGKRSHRSNSRKSRHGNQMMSFDSYSPQTEAALANPPMEMEVDVDDHKHQPDSFAYATAMAEEPADLKQPEDEQIMQRDSIAHANIAMVEEPAELKQPDDEQIMQHDSIAHDNIAMVEEPADLKQPDDEQIMQHDSIAHANIAMVEEPADLKQPDDEQIMQPDSTTDMEEEPCVADDEVIPETSTTQFSGKSKEEIAAIKIQTVYRGHMARKDWRVLRARRRLRVMIKGQAVKRQTASTLMCMQTMARVQSQVRSRRIRMAEVNKDLQRQLLQKTKKALDRVKSSEKIPWDLSPKSKEQVEASLRKKRETAERREKALAYIHTHQQIWRNSLRSANPTSTEPWGWSWLDRWNAVRPWEPATSNTESPSKPALLSASSKGSLYSMQSIRGSPNDSLRSSSVANASKGSTKSTKVRSKISTHAPGRLVSGKQGGSSSRLGVVSTKKQISSSGSSSGLRRSMGPRRTKF
ncbi:uncharacterized protein LOC112510464 [Cynara cardunculus var. scolymus]|uniref:uncharacterized protein LOC112510464 n=1 Tax=Cynara cardunculus var. scolymus TaxID=59895 RepID=UPI000D62D1B1|nr:uncharacterized protein LOC112510464 [Cynara cardunculus var. scolymus]